MKIPMVAVFDKKTGLYDNPFAVRHIGEAVREWDIVRKDEKTRIGKNPEDFELYQVGEYDDQVGKFNNLETQLHLASGI